MQTIGDNPCIPEIIGNYFNYRYDKYGVWIGDKYVSQPYFSYGNADAALMLNDKSKWEIRGFEPVSDYYSADKVSSFLSLEEGKDEQFNLLKSNVRRKIYKSSKNGIKIKSGGSELTDDFYEMYFQNMHYLGSPALAKGFFNEILLKYRNGNAKIFIAYYDNKPIGSAFLLSYGDFYENCWFATIRKYNYLYTSYLLHWEMIKFSIENNAKVYSFGRSNKESSVHFFKKQWNTEDFTLYWSYNENKKIHIRKLGFLSKIWKFSPGFIVRILGPFFAKKIY